MYDTGGGTAVTAANILFEMLCSLPGVKYHRRKWKQYCVNNVLYYVQLCIIRI